MRDEEETLGREADKDLRWSRGAESREEEGGPGAQAPSITRRQGEGGRQGQAQRQGQAYRQGREREARSAG